MCQWGDTLKLNFIAYHFGCYAITLYSEKIILEARNKVYQTANFAMIEAYWNIGKSILEQQGW